MNVYFNFSIASLMEPDEHKLAQMSTFEFLNQWHFGNTLLKASIYNAL